MDKTISPQVNVILLVALLIGAASAMCAFQARFGPNNRELTPLPTRADGKPYRSFGWLVTPLPEEHLYLGIPTEIDPPGTPEPSSRFEIENEYVAAKENSQIYTLYVYDRQTNNTVRLGDDSGHARYAASDDRYVIWTFLCMPQCQTFKQGIYAYDSMSVTYRYINEKSSDNTIPKLDKPWMIYVHLTDYKMSRGSLYAYNLETHEQFLLTTGIFGSRLSSTTNYGINDGQAYWVSDTEVSQAIHVFNFSTRIESQFKASEPIGPQRSAIFEDYFVWYDEFWQGYRLHDESYFTIPVVPPGWDDERIRDADVIDIKDDQIFWKISLGRRTRYFTSPILIKGLPTGQ